MDAPFWKTKSLAELNDWEWESLCDGCGRCCLVKLEDEDDGTIYFTDIGCRLLDSASCRCGDYANRTARVHDCVRLTADNLAELNWLPPTCAYRLVAAGRDLYWWHPLVSGDGETVHAAGVSVRGRVFSDEDAVPEDHVADHIVSWPTQCRSARSRKVPALIPRAAGAPPRPDLRKFFWNELSGPALFGCKGGDPRAPRPRRRPHFSPGQRFLPNSGRGGFFLKAPQQGSTPYPGGTARAGTATIETALSRRK